MLLLILFMPFYSFEMLLVGIILFSVMIVGGIKIWIKQRQNNLEKLYLKDDSEQQISDSGKNSKGLDKR